MISYDQPRVKVLKMNSGPVMNQYFTLVFQETNPGSCDPETNPQTVPAFIAVSGGSIQINIANGLVVMTGTIGGGGSFSASGPFTEERIGTGCTISHILTINGVFGGSSLTGSYIDQQNEDDADPACAGGQPDQCDSAGTVTGTPV